MVSGMTNAVAIAAIATALSGSPVFTAPAKIIPTSYGYVATDGRAQVRVIADSIGGYKLHGAGVNAKLIKTSTGYALSPTRSTRRNIEVAPATWGDVLVAKKKTKAPRWR
jgi:hypothetical protein